MEKSYLKTENIQVFEQVLILFTESNNSFITFHLNWPSIFDILLLVDLACAKFLLAFCLDEVSLAAAPSFCDLADLNFCKNL